MRKLLNKAWDILSVLICVFFLCFIIYSCTRKTFHGEIKKCQAVESYTNEQLQGCYDRVVEDMKANGF